MPRRADSETGTGAKCRAAPRCNAPKVPLLCCAAVPDKQCGSGGRMFRTSSLLIAALLVSVAGCVIAPKMTDSTPDGLVRVQSKRVDMLFIAPGMSLSRYKRVMFEKVDVAFKADWQVNHPNIAPEDIANIRYGAASVFRSEFAQQLEKGGYAISEAPGPDVLRVSASIVDLGIIGGSTAGTEERGHSYIVSTADMSLVAELRDSQSGA